MGPHDDGKADWSRWWTSLGGRRMGRQDDGRVDWSEGCTGLSRRICLVNMWLDWSNIGTGLGVVLV